MTEEKITPLRERMMEDMRIRGMGDKARKSHIRAIKDFARFLKRSPDTATPEELRAYQLHMTDTGVTASTFNTRIVALRFFFGMTCGREDMKRFMQFRTRPGKLPVGFSVEEVSDLLMATKGCRSRATALTTVFKLCQSAARKWRRLDGAHRLVEIIEGVKFKDGEKLIERAA